MIPGSELLLIVLSKMRFVLKTVQNGCRLGCVTQTEDTSCKHMNTPSCMLYSRGGSAPHLTRDLLDAISNTPGMVQMSLTLLAEHEEILKQYGKGISSFVAMKDFMVYCTVQDSAELVPAGYHSNAGISVWGRGGKMTFNVDNYMKTVDALQPSWYQALCDSDTNHASSRKRIRKSVDRTLQYIDQCIEQQKQLPRLKQSEIIGVIEGGFCLEERLRSARETVKRPVSGVCLEGFHSFGPDTESFRVSTITDLLRTVLVEIPADKPRLLPGLWNPLDILHAVRLGIDIFDSSYPYVMTNRGSALAFNFGQERKPASVDESPEISLKDNRFREDLTPLVEHCECYTCRTHTRAYIHHLLDTSELLSNVLLMIHNFHHYFGFFQSVRDAIVDNTLDELERRLSSYKYPTTSLDIATEDNEQNSVVTIDN